MSNLTPNMPQNTWTVTSQQQTMQLDTNGRPTQGYAVYFTTGLGVNGSVFIPLAQYNPVNVRAAIAAHAHQLDLVQQLSAGQK